MQLLTEAFQQTAERRAQHLAVGDPALMLTYAELHAVARNVAQRIQKESGARNIGILLPTSSLGAVALLACWYAGRVPVPLNFLLAAEELAEIVRDAELDLILTVSHFAASAEVLRKVTGATPLELDGRMLREPGPAALQVVNASPEDTAVILYTSGTQGRPKGVCLTHHNLLSNTRGAIEYAHLTENEVFLNVLPQFHCFGLTVMTIIPLVLGATVHYLPRFTPLALLETMRERNATVFIAVASMYAALLANKSAAAEHFASLRLVISGGEPLAPAVFSAFQERFGVTIYEGYGLTEASPVVSWNTLEFHRHGSVGRPLPGVQVFAGDTERRSLASGKTGELMVRGPTVMKGYYKQPEATAASIQDGVLATGDLGHVDEDGYIFITGRAKDMIIVAGDNVYPREVENVLMSHPAVAEAVVIGAPDPLRGEQPVAFVILKPGASATEMELRGHCRERLAGFKVPRSVQIEPDLPRGPTGKILKRVLKERLAAKNDS